MNEKLNSSQEYPTVNRKYKDLLFRLVFSKKEDLLSLYNAVNGTSYTDPSDLEVTTLENALYLSMKNDLGFLVSVVLNLYEHQSTYNPNMTMRGYSSHRTQEQGDASSCLHVRGILPVSECEWNS